MHLFCDDMDSLITAVEAVSPPADDLLARVEALEGEVAELKERLDSLLAHREINRDREITHWRGGVRGIAQKAWLPVLGAADGWTLQAAWSPGKEKALRICEGWRIPYADSLEQLAAQCDAVFVHTSTASHFEVVSRLLNAGVHVCVDKPLADKLNEAESLVELAARRKLTLMVGFNRRFAPLYRELKTQMGSAASLRMDKHRSDSVGHDLRFTLLDDYLHVVDTALWLAGGTARLSGGSLQTTAQGEMLYAEHHFSTPQLEVTTSMHRRAGSQREWVQAVTDGGLYAVCDMREWQEERGQGDYAPGSGLANHAGATRVCLVARATSSNACKIRRFRKLRVNRRCWPNGWLKTLARGNE